VGKRILAVDDEVIMREVYMAILSDEGYEVTVAKDGLEAVKALEVETPDLVLLDIEMPKLNGWEFLEIIRRKAEWHEIPVIMVTGWVEPSAAEQASLPNYSCYLTKKKTGQDLLVLVEKALDGTLEE